MSVDVFLQGFSNGDAADGDGEAAMAVLAPLIANRIHGSAVIETLDGSAEVYGIDSPSSGVSFSHVNGRDAWDVIVDVARAAGFMIMPVGCGTFLLDDSARTDLPVGIPHPVVTIDSADELLAAIRTQ